VASTRLRLLRLLRHKLYYISVNCQTAVAIHAPVAPILISSAQTRTPCSLKPQQTLIYTHVYIIKSTFVGVLTTILLALHVIPKQISFGALVMHIAIHTF